MPIFATYSCITTIWNGRNSGYWRAASFDQFLHFCVGCNYHLFGSISWKVGSKTLKQPLMKRYNSYPLVMTQLWNLERLLPGKFDIWGHSHQLFHIVTGIGALLQLYAILEMQEYASQTECENIMISNTTEILPVNDRWLISSFSRISEMSKIIPMKNCWGGSFKIVPTFIESSIKIN